MDSDTALAQETAPVADAQQQLIADVSVRTYEKVEHLEEKIEHLLLGAETLTEIDEKELDPRPSETRRVLENKIGEGAFGLVYKAKYKGRFVAVKTMLKPAESVREQFVHEAKMIANLHHPGVQRLVGVCSDGSSLCVVTEYIDGVDLLTLLEKYPDMSVEARVRLAISICVIVK